jgi:hypothetical protein
MMQQDAPEGASEYEVRTCRKPYVRPELVVSRVVALVMAGAGVSVDTGGRRRL